MTAVKHKTLFKRDSKGKVRVWWVETDEDQYRVVSGLQDGKLVESDWKTAVPKNVGRSNETTGATQALSQMESLYDKQQNQGKYHDDIDRIDDEGYFEPMLAEKWNDSKDKKVGIKAIAAAFAAGTRVFVQPKLDGIRNLAKQADMRSRDGQLRVSSPHVHADLKAFFDANPDAVVDGELYNHAYHSNFNKLQSLILQSKPKPEDLAASAAEVQYHVYDMFDPETPDAPFSVRTEYLNRIAAQDFGPSIVVVPTFEVVTFDEIDEIYGRLLGEGYEGIVIRLDAPYENDRTTSLIKRKEFFDEEFVLVDILEGTGNWNGKAKSVRFKYLEGSNETTDAGIRGNEAEMAELLRNKQKFIGGDVTIRFPNKTPAGKPRFGQAVAFYEGRRTS